MNNPEFRVEYYSKDFLDRLTKEELVEEYWLLQEEFKALERDLYDIERNRRKWAGSTSFLR